MTDNVDNIMFMDTETRAEDGTDPSDGSVKTAGAHRYSRHAFINVLTYAIGRGPVRCVALDRGFDGDWLVWKEMPEDFRAFVASRVLQGTGWVATWNAAFDRLAWNNGTYDFPLLKPEHTLDIMAQAVASNLPPSLEGASRAIGREGKQQDGKNLITLFASAGGATPQSHPEEWERYKSYGIQDTDELREVFLHTRPLPLEEWEDYWVNERINDRGMRIDLDFAARCAALADADRLRSNRLIGELTGEAVDKITQVQRLAEWIYDRLHRYPEARDIMVKEYDEDSEDDLKPARLSLDRDRISKLLAFFKTLEEQQDGLDDEDWVIVDLLELREYGGSSSPQKFGKMLRQHVDGRLMGQYVFNGANQTGRFSSRGVQVHNLVRKSLGEGVEEKAIEMINEVEI